MHHLIHIVDKSGFQKTINMWDYTENKARKQTSGCELEISQEFMVCSFPNL